MAAVVRLTVVTWLSIRLEYRVARLKRASGPVVQTWTTGPPWEMATWNEVGSLVMVRLFAGTARSSSGSTVSRTGRRGRVVAMAASGRGRRGAGRVESPRQHSGPGRA